MLELVEELIYIFLLINLIIFPGFFFFSFRQKEINLFEKLPFIVCLSIGINALVFSLLNIFGVYIKQLIILYFLILLFIFINQIVVLKKSIIFKSESIYFPFIVFILCMFCFFIFQSFLSSPYLWDSLYYHLPIAKMFANPRLYDFYSHSGGSHQWLLEGSSGFNLLPRFLSVSFLFSSLFYKIVQPVISICYLIILYNTSQKLKINKLLSLILTIVVSISPLYLSLSSDYYNDLLLGLFILCVVNIFIQEKPNRALAGILIGLAILVKKSAIILIFLPFIFSKSIVDIDSSYYYFFYLSNKTAIIEFFSW